ncbi:MAG: MGMT family protein [Vicinamibacterales bacterium]
MTRAPTAASSSAADRFARRVLAVASRIPPGRVCTYGEIAAMAGAPRAARAVGNVMAQARLPGVPYHRVVAAGGLLGGYSDLATKRALLAAEGLEVTRTRVRHFDTVRWPSRRRRR